MFIIKSRQEERGYQYVTLELSTKNYSETEHNDREKFLMRAIKSYYSIEGVLDNENLFDLLAYNFATKQLHFLFLSSKKQEIKDFLEFIRDQYVEWTDNEINFEIITNKSVSEEMLMSTSAHIHTLTERWEDGYHSSLRSYLFDDAPVWLACRHIKKSYGSAVDYYEYLKVFKNKELLIELKSLVPAQSA